MGMVKVPRWRNRWRTVMVLDSITLNYRYEIHLHRCSPDSFTIQNCVKISKAINQILTTGVEVRETSS